MATKNQQRRERLQKKELAKKNDDSDMDFLNKTIQENQTKADLTQVVTKPSDNLPNENGKIPRQKIIEKANEMWKTIKAYVSNHPDYKTINDQDKLDIFRTKFGYSIFMEEFPIVSRYMVCYGQYSAKAFEKMLRKIENVVHPAPDKRDKGYMEDQWVSRQADYVQFLWESYQKRHQNTAERQWIWKETYDRLKKEFDDFRDMHKEIEDRVKTEKKTLAGQNARELLERIAENKQSVTAEEEEFMLEQLKNVFETRNNPVAPDDADIMKQKEPKILMIETVDADRMDEIDDKYK